MATLRYVVLYFQSEREAPGNPGWAYNMVDSAHGVTSDGLAVGPADDGGESLTDVRDAFFRVRAEVREQIVRWDPCPEGGWRGVTARTR